MQSIVMCFFESCNICVRADREQVNVPAEKALKAISLFTGIGGLEVGLEPSSRHDWLRCGSSLTQVAQLHASNSVWKDCIVPLFEPVHGFWLGAL